MDTRLIVLRGPSGAGKSSVAARLLEAPRPTALISQDAYRFIFNVREGEPYSNAVRHMIRDNVLCALRNGFDVIVEGVLKARTYREIFAAIFEEHPRSNHVYYLDISFEETLRRHRTRTTAGLWTDDDMRSWYEPHDVLGHHSEHVIGEDRTLEDTVQSIRRAIA